MKSYLYSHNTDDNPVLMTDKRLARENDEWLTTYDCRKYCRQILSSDIT